MAVVLTILKFIGIFLLAVLGLVLVIAALVLFAPVCYKVICQSRFGMMYSVRVSWLLGAVSVVKENASEQFMLKVFGIPIRCLYGEKENKPEKSEWADREKNDRAKVRKATEEKAQNEETELRIAEVSEQDFDIEQPKKKKRTRKKKKSFSFDRVSGIIDFVRSAENKRAFKKLLSELKRLLIYLSPRTIQGKVEFGTGDPSSTGLLTGGLSLFPVIYRDEVSITPNFEEKIFRAEGEVRGRLQVWWFVWTAIRIYREKELIDFWKRINNTL